MLKFFLSNILKHQNILLLGLKIQPLRVQYMHWYSNWQGWEFDLSIFDLLIFLIFKKIDRDIIALVDHLKRSTVSE